MSQDKPQIAEYGLYFKANNQLIPNATDRVLFQFLVDTVRLQLKRSLSDQTVFLSNVRLGDRTNLDSNRTIPSSLSRLASIGIIDRHPNAITVRCDEYVTLVKYFEGLEGPARKQFCKDFSKEGIAILGKLGVQVTDRCREELVNQTGSSLTVQKCTDLCNITDKSDNIVQTSAILQTPLQHCRDLCTFTDPSAIIQSFLSQISKTLQLYSDFCTFEEAFAETQYVNLPHQEFEKVKYAFWNGKLEEPLKNDLQNLCNITEATSVLLQRLTPKTSVILQTSNNIYNKKEIKPASLSEKGEDGFPLKPLSDVEGFQPSSNSEEFEDSLGIIELVDQKPFGKSSVDNSQLVKNKISNPYKDKPYFSEKEAKKITASLDPALTYDSPVKLFINLFWWGCWDLYVENYDARDYDENGDPIDNEDVNDLKMIDAVLPATDLLKLAEQIYEDIDGAMEKGVYEDAYGKYKLDFNSLDDFQPHFIFDWEEAEINGQPGLKVSLKRFRNIEANIIEKVPVPKTRSEIAAEAKLDRSFTKIIMESQLGSLTPMEQLVRAFYSLFVKFSDDYRPEYFTNTEHEPIEGHSLPGYIYKPQVSFWCNDHDITTDELFSTLSQTERQVFGADIKMTRNIFSVRKVHRWNVAHGYELSVAESIINQQS